MSKGTSCRMYSVYYITWLQHHLVQEATENKEWLISFCAVKHSGALIMIKCPPLLGPFLSHLLQIDFGVVPRGAVKRVGHFFEHPLWLLKGTPWHVYWWWETGLKVVVVIGLWSLELMWEPCWLDMQSTIHIVYTMHVIRSRSYQLMFPVFKHI